MSYRRIAVTASVMALSGLSQILAGATLCVTTKPTSTCPYSTINAAVTAASAGDTIQVKSGTYKEDVIIGKPLSLVGQSGGYKDGNTVIDATGLANGIYIDGLDHSGLTGVSVSGFVIKNANFEGILVTNASDVTISNNTVVKNNVALVISGPSCPGIPGFETGESFDCGEGIHLSGVDHSIVARNYVAKNSGGILLSDDTAATHDNLIESNTVEDNPFDCGITLASHPLYPALNTAAGVFHNTILSNVSRHNGFQVPGAGAGVGLFAPAPFTKTYGNVVVNNTVTDNGLPGVALHAHSPGANVDDNMIAGNTISDNAADTEDTATPGPTGINVSGGDNGSGIPLGVITGTVIADNVIDNETDAIVTKTNSLVIAHLNDLDNNSKGIVNIDGGTVDGTLNYWGCPGGPTAGGCSGVSGAVIYVPFLTSGFESGQGGHGHGHD